MLAKRDGRAGVARRRTAGGWWGCKCILDVCVAGSPVAVGVGTPRDITLWYEPDRSFRFEFTLSC